MINTKIPIKIYFLCDSAAGGGAERILTYLVNTIDRKQFKPSLFLLVRPDIGYLLNPDVSVRFLAHKKQPPALNFVLLALSIMMSLPWIVQPRRLPEHVRYCRQVLIQLLGGMSTLGRLLRQDPPQVVVVFLQTSIVITLMACSLFRIRIPVCCSDRILLSEELRQRRFPRLNRWLLRYLFRRATGFIAVSEEARQDLIMNFQVKPERIRTIYNGLNLDEISTRAQEPLNWKERDLFQPSHFHFVAAGRLSEQKEFTLLIEAFRQVRDALPCRLLILGEGEQRAALEGLIRQLGLHEDVVLAGWVDNPFRLMLASDAFVLSSRYEGFPNVLLEAMAVGLPVISTDCPSGPAELLCDGEYGLLVPPGEVSALAAAMRKLAEDETFRTRMRAKAQERIREFGLQRMVEQFEAYCCELAGAGQ